MSQRSSLLMLLVVAASSLTQSMLNEASPCLASEYAEGDSDGKEKKLDKGKYKRRHTRVMEFLLVKDFSKARQRLDKWLAADPDDPENYYMLAVIECQSGNVSNALAAMKRALELGMLPDRFVGGTHTLLDPIKSDPSFQALAKPLADRLIHGPMVAAVTPNSAKIWVRTARPASLQIATYPIANPENGTESATVRSNLENDLTAVIAIEGLKPSTEYRYAVMVNGREDRTEKAYQSFTTAPEIGKPAKFSIAFGGCAGYTPSNERMWDNVRRFKPRAFWFLGDNEYIDQPEMPALQYYCFYRRQARPEFRRLVASTPIYAIYDDHDFGTNDCSGGPEIESPAWKREVWNVFRQTWVNPSYGGGNEQPGCWFDYHYGDVHFVFLDGRYYRANAEHGVSPPTMLGPVQKKWLFDTLAASKSKIKVLISPVTWALDTKGDSPDTWHGYQQERQEIFDFLTDRKISGVILVSSDRHRSDFLENKRANAYTLHEFNSGLLTNDSVHPELPTAEFSFNDLPSFGLIDFDTVAQDASVTYRIIDINGQQQFAFTVHESDLR